MTLFPAGFTVTIRTAPRPAVTTIPSRPAAWTIPGSPFSSASTALTICHVSPSEPSSANTVQPPGQGLMARIRRQMAVASSLQSSSPSLFTRSGAYEALA